MRLACLAALVLAGSVRAEDVANPEFASWSKHKKGTKVTLKSITTINQDAHEQILTQTLDEVAADKVAVVTEVTINVKGNVLKPNALREEMPKTKKLAKGAKKEDALAGKPEGTLDEGKETLKLNGVEYKTRWFKYKYERSGKATEGQVWLCDDAPGLVVQKTETTGGQVAVVSVTSLVEIKKP